jgi:hypothetical protein
MREKCKTCVFARARTKVMVDKHWNVIRKDKVKSVNYCVKGNSAFYTAAPYCLDYRRRLSNE